MKRKFSWAVLAAIVIFAISSWIFVRKENDVRISFDRAREVWRNEEYFEAGRLFQDLVRKYPRSSLADDALWEVATTYYLNLYDIPSSIEFFQRLIAEYPNSPKVPDAHKYLAEIFDKDLNEPSSAVLHWKAALEYELPEDEVSAIRLWMGDALFKQGEINEASEQYQLVRSSAKTENFVCQALLRIGIVFQVKKQYEESIEVFREVVENQACLDSGLQAKFLLIESYEAVDRLNEAISVAESISESEVPEERRKEILDRLLEKRQYYNLELWNK